MAKKAEELAFEESLGNEVGSEVDLIEVPLKNSSFVFLGIVSVALTAGVTFRLGYLGITLNNFYAARAAVNANARERISAPRGIVYDRFGKVIAENRPIFLALLDLKEFLKSPDEQSSTLKALHEHLGVAPEEVWQMIRERDATQTVEPLVLSADLTQGELVQLSSLRLPALTVTQGFERHYPEGDVFSAILGYTGLATANDLKNNPSLTSQDVVGKTGLEYLYDEWLQGKPGLRYQLRTSKGEVVEGAGKRDAMIGKPLHVTIDAEFQSYFYNRFKDGLAQLGRESGAGIALNPQTGEVLGLVSFPSFDSNVMSGAGRNGEKRALLTSEARPLFNRAISGVYNPGSTIKPLLAVAGLTEGTIDPNRRVFSPGYLEIPNPYHPDQPTRILDWKRHGWVTLIDAIAKSSNVYFFLVGGGSPHPAIDGQGGFRGLGIEGLRTWWQKFHLGQLTGVDLPGEAKGYLPDPTDTAKNGGRTWLLGDTYNVSIGQGNLMITPIQLLSYISTIATDGKLFTPFLVNDTHAPAVENDLSSLAPAFEEAKKGMREVVESPDGTAHSLSYLPFAVSAKTGSAQIKNNTQVNALFVGFAPSDNPQIAILVLVENSKEGSPNTIPIAKDALNWYYEHRLKK